MDREFATPDVIVVHARQIVMHKAVAMNALDRERNPERAFAVHMIKVAGRNHQKRPHPLAAADRGMAHRLEQLPPGIVWNRKQAVEALIDRLDRKSTRLNPVTNAHLVCRLLLEKKKTDTTTHTIQNQ